MRSDDVPIAASKINRDGEAERQDITVSNLMKKNLKFAKAHKAIASETNSTLLVRQ